MPDPSLNPQPDVVFEELELPTCALPEEVPEVPSDVFRRRFAALEERREAADLDALVVYADREHAANMRWLTGFDPRFEEALWIQGVGTPTLLAGNECLPFARAVLQVGAEVRLYQHFSLPDQPRGSSTDLPALLRDAGLADGMRVGMIGWKPAGALPAGALDVPSWIVEAVRGVTGVAPTNAAALVMDPATGLRVRIEPEAMPYYEYAGALTSEAVKAWALGLREGQREIEAGRALQHAALELSCHPMVNFGPTIPSGLKSPRNARVTRGWYAQAALGVVGSLTSRAGRLVSRAEADDDPDGYLPLVRNYLQVVRAWYAQIRVGARAGDAVAAADAVRADSWDFALNPGHLLEVDEWVGSPFKAGSDTRLASGNAVQQDIIPVPREGDAVLNMEDGFLLADEATRARLAREQPAMLRRCEERRAFLRELGYVVSDDLLPTSNTPGVLMPFLLEPGVIARFR